MRKAAASSTAEPTNEPIVSAEPHPTVGARVSPYTNSINPPVTVTAPATSKCRAISGARLSRTTLGTISKTPRPIGTLTKKIHSQPTNSVSTPPTSSPIAAPPPAIAPRIPSALLRSDPSSNVTVTIEKTDGDRTAAAAP